jgi:hypothetical protein
MSHLVTIKRRVPSQNQVQYGHWSRYAKERDMWFILLRQQLPPQQSVTVPTRIAIRSFRTRLLDYANLVGGAKPIPDCLIRLGYLKDDSPDWFRCTYEQFRVGKDEERTEIEFLPWDGLLGD